MMRKVYFLDYNYKIKLSYILYSVDSNKISIGGIKKQIKKKIRPEANIFLDFGLKSDIIEFLFTEF